ncbi:MAG: hypothetical protein GY861_18520 [bacterium]|nr:hypothetical protein [bacterium]
MAKQRMINTNFWSDPFIQDLTPTEKLIFLYFISNEHTDICGIYEISEKTILFECGITKDVFTKAMEKFSAAKKMYYINNWIYIVNFVKNQNSNPSVKEGIKRSMDRIPAPVLDKVQAPTASDRLRQPGLPNLTKPNLTKLKTTNVVEPKAQHGNKEINDMLLALKKTVKLDDFKEPQKQQRWYAHHFNNLFKKIEKQEFTARLQLILGDDFKAKNCNSIKYLYGQMKSTSTASPISIRPKERGGLNIS